MLSSMIIWQTLNSNWKLKSGEFHSRNSFELTVTFQKVLFKDWGHYLIWKFLVKEYAFKVLVTLSRLILCDPMDYSPPGSSVCWILQASILRWVVVPFSMGSSQPRIEPGLLHCRQILYHLSHQGSLNMPLGFVFHYKCHFALSWRVWIYTCTWASLVADVIHIITTYFRMCSISGILVYKIHYK